MASRPKHADPRPQPRLYLVTPAIEDAAGFVAPLDAALDAGDVAAVMLRLAPADERSLINRIKELRAERGWTQQELADAVGVSRQSINSIERERYEPSLSLALAFARVFGRPTDNTFQIEEKKK